MRRFGPALLLLIGTPLLGEGIAGRVVDPRGAPVAGVEVWLLDRGGPERAAVTSADGRFALAEVAARYALEFCRPGYLSGNFTRLSDAAVPAPLDIVLAPAARVAGRVLDAAGRPLAGAEVGALRLGDSGIRCDTLDRRPCQHDHSMQNTTTGSDGRFLLDYLEPGLYGLRAAAEGFLNAPPRHLELAAGELQLPDLVLEPGAVLRGRVVDTDGRPLASVRLMAGGGRSHWANVQSGAGGEFVLAGLEPGKIEVYVHPPERDHETQAVEVGPGENRADLVYGAGRVELRGRVVDLAGRPVAGARVVRSGEGDGEAVTGADGGFALPARDGLHELHAEARGYAPARLERPLRVRGATVEGLELRLAPGVTLHARVAGGEARVDWVEARQGHVLRRAEHTPGGRLVFDAEGRTAIAGLGPGRWTVRAGGPDAMAEAEIEIAPGERTVSVELEPLARFTVEGRVLDPDGLPVPNAALQFREEGQRYMDRTSTREDGSFSLRLGAGTYRLVGSAPGYAAAAEEPLRVEDAPLRGIELRLGEPLPLAGRVVGLDAAGLLEVEVLARQGDIEHRVRVDPAGEFELAALGDGPWEVTARVGPRVARSRVRLEGYGAEPPVEIVFPERLLTLAGRVTGAVAPELLEVELSVPGELYRLAALPLDEAGRFRLAGLAAGAYELSVRDRAADRVLHRGTFALTTDRTIVVPLREAAK